MDSKCCRYLYYKINSLQNAPLMSEQKSKTVKISYIINMGLLGHIQKDYILLFAYYPMFLSFFATWEINMIL